MAEKKAPLCIYHGNCTDGFAAAWAVRNALPGAEFVAASYGSTPPDVTGRTVYIVDFSYPRDVLLAMAEKATQIVVLDHHKTVAEQLVDLPSNVKATFDMDRSGCMLAWQHFFGHELPPMLLLHIQDRDLWTWSLPHTKEILAAVFSYPHDFDVWDRLMWGPLDALRDVGAALVRKHDKDIESLITSARLTEIAGHQVPTVNLPPTMASDAGAALAKGHPFAAVYWDTRSGRQYSLRSAPDGIDVAAIAQQFGGGGHKHAAGFKVSSGHPLTVPFPVALQVEDGEIGRALAYSRNYAEASPYLNATAQEHIHGLCNLLERTAARLSQGAQGKAKCHRCGATSEAQAESMCIPDGDSCPGCEKPLSDQWKAERAAVPDGMVLVTREDGNNYCRILTLLGMEEEGDAVEAIEKLLAAPQPPEGARVVDGWLFYFADDDGGPHAHYCGTRDEVYAHVAEWMTGDRDGNALSDAGDDMIEGVTATLIESGAFHPEGEPPCFLRKIAAPTLAGKES